MTFQQPCAQFLKSLSGRPGFSQPHYEGQSWLSGGQIWVCWEFIPQSPQMFQTKNSILHHISMTFKFCVPAWDRHSLDNGFFPCWGTINFFLGVSVHPPLCFSVFYFIYFSVFFCRSFVGQGGFHVPPPPPLPANAYIQPCILDRRHTVIDSLHCSRCESYFSVS